MFILASFKYFTFRVAFLCVVFLPYPVKASGIVLFINDQDTLKINQSLYTGKVWSNNYRRIIGDQFLFASYFLQGTVSAGGRTYQNLKLRYDIHNDELNIPVSREEILRLNKEMIDSFSIKFENKTYRFLKMEGDSASELTGYFHILYKNLSSLYIKFQKKILPTNSDENDGEFSQTRTIYLVRNNTFYRIRKKNDLYEALNTDKFHVRDLLKTNKIRISMNIPESYIPLLRLFDNTGSR